MTPEFLAQYKESYGPPYRPRPADYARCAQSVISVGIRSEQCSRKNGHGPHGAWCKQHDPVAVEAKKDAKWSAYKAELDQKQRDREFTSACRDAIRAIAAGHNDPRGLAQSIIDKLEAAE